MAHRHPALSFAIKCSTLVQACIHLPSSAANYKQGTEEGQETHQTDQLLEMKDGNDQLLGRKDGKFGARRSCPELCDRDERDAGERRM